MRKRFLVMALAAASCFAVGQAPSGRLNVGTSTFDVPLVELRPGVWGITSPVTFASSDASVTLNALEMDSDPFISYGLSVSDFGAPSSFLFTFTTPIVLPGGPNIVFGSIVGGLTDTFGNGVSLTPTGTSGKTQESSVGMPMTNMGVNVGDAATHGASFPGAQYNYGVFSAGPFTGMPGAWTTLEVKAGFGLSGDGDIAVLTGYASINPVPEPATMLVLGLGLSGLLARRRLR